jgi:hypothetical protein
MTLKIETPVNDALIDAPVNDARIAGMVHEAGTGIKSDRNAILENSLKVLFEGFDDNKEGSNFSYKNNYFFIT